MSRPNSITALLNVSQEETVLIQGKVPRSLRDRARKELRKRGVSWDEFFTASVKAYLAEIDSKEKK